MFSLKDAAAELQELDHDEAAQNKYDMSVTPDVSQVEMWPYVASAAVASESQGGAGPQSLCLLVSYGR